ncbi:cytochrome P450 [Blyttiomyces helicus]|uniref:Cytochrome P450 n=1 Tax=Blyttiomyces helicus TaxID=388810 RepID=A0A4P9W0D0_9FUNG|nr:cytochrome P450 [Blyttiomyces helicus]|eukprot:RKO85534.1 cytochrome P450 [Blyttiomyces helicus]
MFSWTIPISLAAVAAFGLSVACLLNPRHPKAAIPGPKGLPFFGIFFDYLPYLRSGKDAPIWTALVKKYGPVARLKLPYFDAVLVADGAEALRILNSPVEFVRDDRVQQGTSMLPVFFSSESLEVDIGTGIARDGLSILPTGELWQKHRKILELVFRPDPIRSPSPTHLRHGAVVAVEVAGGLISAFESRCAQSHVGKAIVNVHEAFAAFTLDALGLISFSHRFGKVKSLRKGRPVDFLQVDGVLPILLTVVVPNPPTFPRTQLVLSPPLGLTQPFRFMSPRWVRSFLNVGLEDAEEAALSFRSLASGFVRAKRWAQQGLEEKNGCDLDVMDNLLDSNGEVRILTARTLWDSTANSIMWVILELSHNPSVLAKLLDDIESVMKDCKEMTIETLPRFTYLDMVVKETMRCDPAFGATPRATACDVTIGGCLVALKYLLLTGPASLPSLKTNVIIMIRDIHLNPTFWPDPTTFDPERWQSPPPPGAFMPFGEGPHACIGQKLAIIETKAGPWTSSWMIIAVISFVRNFEFTFVPGEDLAPFNTITTGLKKGLLIELSPRA